MKVSGSSKVSPWKCGRAKGLIFFILVSPSASHMGKALRIPAMVKIGASVPLIETRSSSSSPISSSKYLEGSPIGGSLSLPLKKSEGWIGGDVGVLGKIYL